MDCAGPQCDVEKGEQQMTRIAIVEDEAAVREQLKIDKGAAARRAASLESKGYLYRKPNPADGRSQLLYATEKAERVITADANLLILRKVLQ